VIAAKAAAFGEALRPSFRAYAKNVVENARALAEILKARGFAIVSGGTDTHLILVDLRPKRLTGAVAEASLGRARIACNKNGIRFDPEKPAVTSGIRIGTPAGTTRGDQLLTARVPKALRKTSAESDRPIRRAQQQCSGIGGDAAALERGHNSSTLNTCESEQIWCTLCLHRDDPWSEINRWRTQFL
jgi:glycine/serine hydroxymethyltransferase